MAASNQRLFLFLIASQALHSIEEYYFALWEVLAPARFVSGLVSSDLPVGFALINLSIVAFGVWSYVVPVRRMSRHALWLVWFWVILEITNGLFHLVFVINVQDYFPGAYTAPLLLFFAGALSVRLVREKACKE